MNCARVTRVVANIISCRRGHGEVCCGSSPWRGSIPFPPKTWWVLCLSCNLRQHEDLNKQGRSHPAPARIPLFEAGFTVLHVRFLMKDAKILLYSREFWLQPNQRWLRNKKWEPHSKMYPTKYPVCSSMIYLSWFGQNTPHLIKSPVPMQLYGLPMQEVDSVMQRRGCCELFFTPVSQSSCFRCIQLLCTSSLQITRHHWNSLNCGCSWCTVQRRRHSPIIFLGNNNHRRLGLWCDVNRPQKVNKCKGVNHFSLERDSLN